MRLALAALVTSAAGLAACATSEAVVQPVAAPVVLKDRSCQSLRSEIMRMESRGTARLVDRKHDGGKVTAAQQAEIDTYNSLLNEYLGARCHLT